MKNNQLRGNVVDNDPSNANLFKNLINMRTKTLLLTTALLFLMVSASFAGTHTIITKPAFIKKTIKTTLVKKAQTETVVGIILPVPPVYANDWEVDFYDQDNNLVATFYTDASMDTGSITPLGSVPPGTYKVVLTCEDDEAVYLEIDAFWNGGSNEAWSTGYTYNPYVLNNVVVGTTDEDTFIAMYND
jgi:hypothetical protein